MAVDWPLSPHSPAGTPATGLRPGKGVLLRRCLPFRPEEEVPGTILSRDRASGRYRVHLQGSCQTVRTTSAALYEQPPELQGADPWCFCGAEDRTTPSTREPSPRSGKATASDYKVRAEDLSQFVRAACKAPVLPARDVAAEFKATSPAESARDPAAAKAAYWRRILMPFSPQPPRCLSEGGAVYRDIKEYTGDGTQRDLKRNRRMDLRGPATFEARGPFVQRMDPSEASSGVLGDMTPRRSRRPVGTLASLTSKDLTQLLFQRHESEMAAIHARGSVCLEAAAQKAVSATFTEASARFRPKDPVVAAKPASKGPKPARNSSFEFDLSADRPIAEVLRDALKAQGVRVIDLFQEWDRDGSGTVTKAEFKRAFKTLKLPEGMLDKADGIFDEWDKDRSGLLTMQELNKILRAGGTVKLDAKLQVGGAGEIEIKAKNRTQLRRKRVTETATFLAFDIDENSEKTVAEQLRDALTANYLRVIELLRQWDTNHDGTVSKAEFRTAMDKFGFDVDVAEVDKLFRSWDQDDSGTVTIQELNAQLRPGNAVQLDDIMYAGAAGEIELKARNAIALRNLDDAEANYMILKLDPSPEAEKSIADQLRDALALNAVRVVDLFRLWDTDHSGSISKAEFRTAMLKLGLDKAYTIVVDNLYDEWDKDKSGSLALNELHKNLRQRAELDPKLLAGGAGEIQVKAKNRHTLRHVTTKTFEESKGKALDIELDPSQLADKDMREQLRDALADQAMRVVDLLRLWDTDGSGYVSQAEFRKAMFHLGLDETYTAEINELFNSFDQDGSGSIGFSELYRHLRAGHDMQIDSKLLPGGAGEIEVLPRRRSSDSFHTGFTMAIDQDSAVSVKEQIRAELLSNCTRVIDIFRKWDANSDGLVSRKEFRESMHRMGLADFPDDINELFDTFDKADSGSILYEELFSILSSSRARSRRPSTC